MRLTNLGNNETLIQYDDNTEILFSYGTPVAGQTWKELPGHTGGCFRTGTKYSVTTSKHINKYLEGRNATVIDQQSINSLVK